MSELKESLLQPSLNAQERPAGAPYSVQTTLLSGFFGGPFAALAILIVNSIRLRRVARDAAVWAIMLALVLLGGWALYVTVQGAQIQAWLTEQLGDNGIRYLQRVVGLLIVGAGYLLHRREQRNTDLAGLDRPNGWIAGIACIVLGIASMVALVSLVVK